MAWLRGCQVRVRGKKLVGISRRIELLNDVDIDRSYEKTVDLGRILQFIGSPLVPGSFEM